MQVNNRLNNLGSNSSLLNLRDPIHILDRLPNALFEDCVLRQFLDFNTYFPLCRVSKNWNEKLKQKIHQAALHWNARDLNLRYIPYLTIWEFLKKTNKLQVEAITNRTQEFKSLTDLFISKICLAKSIELSNEMGLKRSKQKMVFYQPDITQFLDSSKNLLSFTFIPFMLDLVDFSKHLPQSLRNLKIYCSCNNSLYGIDNPTITAIAKSCPNLEQLSLTSNPTEGSIADIGLNSLADSCPKLTHVHFSNINFNSCIDGFYNIGIKYLRLKSLCIELKKGATENFFEAICKLPQNSVSLEKLIIQDNYQLNMESIQIFHDADLQTFSLGVSACLKRLTLLKKTEILP